MIEDLEIGKVAVGNLSASVATGVHCRLDLPYERPPASLWANTRSHWRRRSAETAKLRADVLLVARSAGLHRWCEGQVRHVTAALVWAPGDRRRRDEDNLAPMQKVCCDALARGPRRDWIGLELVPDDTREHFTKLAPRIDPPPAKGMWLELLLEFGVPA